MGVGAGRCMYDVVVKSSRSLYYLLISFLLGQGWLRAAYGILVPGPVLRLI